MKKVAEFIMGFYDRNTGNFPLGETGVAIKVQKEFGDKAGELAERLIQKMAEQGGANDELSDIKRLSGMQSGMEEELDPNYKTPNLDAHDQRMQDPALSKASGELDDNSRGSASMGAYQSDERGQRAYKDRASGGVINKVKDFVGYDKPDPKYGPKTIKEGVEYTELQRLAGIGIKTKATGKSSEVFDLKKLAGI
jgi:hypothetical protein